MLVLSRNIGQSIVIDGNIVVTILQVDGKQVRVGVEAPKDVTVNRNEIQERVDKGLPRQKK